MESFKTNGVCTKGINFEVRDGKVYSVKFNGGCDGNLKAIAKLVEGRPIEEVISLLKGNTCGPRSTSCTDQLAKALEKQK